ncbi:hypothetical protein CTAYLR_005158 [Chrysophaeum taylorii]|uniref:Cell division protein FtsZ n=1 Tax=Chrysophaeum taylorii TaxID=2483200 RepID=A0AAD7ULY7_9STRA|nr:hypothetical protein CTAYLR_005158 [Chrysophaeum taylorii]
MLWWRAFAFLFLFFSLLTAEGIKVGGGGGSVTNELRPCEIRVIGVGGGGGNAINRMLDSDVRGVSFWCVNTDAQALASSRCSNRLHIGRDLTRGLGAGGDPSVGREAALESTKDVTRMVAGADMVFVTAGMGGGTGSGAAPVVAAAAKASGALTVGVVTKPFAFEGRRRMKQAISGIEALQDECDTIIVISNDKLLSIVPANTPVTEAFLVADDILRQGIIGISEIIVKPGLINVDFADVKAVMQDAGSALMGIGTGRGPNRAVDAAVAAISSPLLDFPVLNAKGIVFNIVGGPGFSIQEVQKASTVIYENVDPDANIIFGASIQKDMENELSITVLATGIQQSVEDAIARAGGDIAPILPPTPTSAKPRTASSSLPGFLRPSSSSSSS